MGYCIIYIYIHIHIERERERARERASPAHPQADEAAMVEKKRKRLEQEGWQLGSRRRAMRVVLF